VSRAGRWPWGYGRAPALYCDECGRHIGQRRSHFILDGTRLLCGRCIDRRELHAAYFPSCPRLWHDLYDHPFQTASRAAAWFLLTDAERKRAS
jgi:hypothetical protein